MSICKKCLHIAVCGRYAATGGKVRVCEHHLEPKRAVWLKKNEYCECSECHVCGSPLWKVCPVCESKMEVMDD